jgi:two-component system sensor histidine kinase TctE
LRVPDSAAGAWPRHPPSIRARLLFWLSVPLVFFLAVDAWASYRTTLASIQLAYDRLLVTSAHAIADLIRLDRGQLVIGLPHAALEIYDQPLATDDQPLARGRMLYRVGFVDGTHLAGDADLQPYTGRPDSHPIYRSMIELYDATHASEPMRVAALLQPVESYDGGRLVVVQVAEVSLYRDILARRVLYDTLQRQAVLLAVVLLLIWTVSTIALRQLYSLAQHLDTRAAHDLAPLPFPRAPLEL